MVKAICDLENNLVMSDCIAQNNHVSGSSMENNLMAAAGVPKLNLSPNG